MEGRRRRRSRWPCDSSSVRAHATAARPQSGQDHLDVRGLPLRGRRRGGGRRRGRARRFGYHFEFIDDDGHAGLLGRSASGWGEVDELSWFEAAWILDAVRPCDRLPRGTGPGLAREILER